MISKMSATEDCENCGRKIGKLEPAHLHNDHVVCPDCAAKLKPPTASYATPTRPRQAETIMIEATAKRWKAIQAVGVAGMVVSVAVLFTALSIGSQPLTYIAAPMLVVSILTYGWARVAGWWHHG